MSNIETDVAVIKSDIKHIGKKMEEVTDSVKDFKISCDKKYVSQARFSPVEKLAYGLAGLILTSVVVAGINIILNQWEKR